MTLNSKRQRSSPARTGRLRHTPAAHRKAASLPSVQESTRSQASAASRSLGSGSLRTNSALFPSPRTSQHCKSVKRIWRTALRKAEISYFRIYDLRSTYATRLSAGGVADEWVVQLLRQGNSDVFKKYSQMKLAMKREALEKLNRRANEMTLGAAQAAPADGGFGTVLVQ